MKAELLIINNQKKKCKYMERNWYLDAAVIENRNLINHLKNTTEDGVDQSANWTK